jgi:protein gp37
MYPFVDWLWNPVTGRCQHDCSYCYVKRIAARFHQEQAAPYLVESELRTNLGRFSVIFVCSGCDLFAPDIPEMWIKRVVDYAGVFDNTYLWHTKNPERASTFLFPPDSILCATMESDLIPPGISNAPTFGQRIEGLKMFKGRRMITIEPILKFGNPESFASCIHSCYPEQVNIGADSGNNHLPEPPPEKIAALIGALRENNIKVYLKKNLKRLYQEKAQ